MILPVPSVEVGPAWATEIVTAMNVIDSHTHTTGSGSSLTLGALNVNQNLNMLQYGITDASYFKSLNNVAPIAGSTATCLYASGGELYYNDNSGNQIKLTASGGINLSSIGTIGGDYSTSTASVAYSTAATTFTFTSNTGIYAKVNTGNLKIFEAVSGGNSVELKTSTGLGGSYALTLPTALPASSLPLIVSSAGVLSTAQVTTAQIADSQVTTIKILDGSVTPAKKSALGQISSDYTGTYASEGATKTNFQILSLSLTTTGRPVFVAITGMISSGYGSFIRTQNISGTTRDNNTQLKFFRDATEICSNGFEETDANYVWISLPTSIFYIDTPAAGTYTYSFKISTHPTYTYNFELSRIRLIAYEI